ncbi:serine/threonine-protein kinase pim-3-like [Danio aesculapii]|uniref:serine/threonine-protein kinase pim-3-like n=1 Tax=Danio aesculapii TaxID=1142201 RepID=UPI0024BF6010|nr:serine/threonine-protein kinase pim-3-like [Danio aesculapii]
MLFTVLGVIALFLRERNINSTVSGQDERFDRQGELVTVPPVTNSDGREIGDWCEDSSLHLEEQINVQTEEPSLEEPVDGQSEEQSLVEPVSVHGEEQSLVEPDSVHGEEPSLVEPDSVHGEEQSLVEPDSVHGEEQSLVEPDSSAKPGCSHDDPPNVVSAKPGCIDDVAQGATCQTEGAVPPQPEEQKNKDTHIIEINSQRYEIGAELGKGGYGTVFAGTRLEDGLQVAVKIADIKVKRFIRVDDFDQPLPSEIALHFLATKGPEVKELVQLLDWKVEADRYFMVLERPIPCVSVGEFLKDHQGRIPEDVLRKIMFHTTIAADTCSTRGVLHRDIKPDNLLMNPQTFEVKLTDFGCGELLTEDYYTTYLGTMQFSPPEFKKTRYYYGEPATVWSLGILQFLLMFKKFPDNRDLRKLKNKNFYQHGRSEECCDFISSCLQTNPWFRHKLNALRAHAWFKRIIKKI